MNTGDRRLRDRPPVRQILGSIQRHYRQCPVLPRERRLIYRSTERDRQPCDRRLRFDRDVFWPFDDRHRHRRRPIVRESESPSPCWPWVPRNEHLPHGRENDCAREEHGVLIES
jgi:hypothetical protein